MSTEAWIKLAELGFIIVQAAALGAIVFLKGTFVTRKQHESGEAGTAKAHHRLDVLEERIKGLPDHATIQSLRDDIGGLKEGQATSRAKLDGLKDGMDLVREQLGRMDDFLRSRP